MWICLKSILEGDIIFIDEIQRIPVKLEEFLYLLGMEDGYIDLGNERMNIASFTLIGATIRLGELISAIEG